MSQKHVALVVRLALILGLSVVAYTANDAQAQMSMPTMKAVLVDADAKAKKQEATVQVTVTGLKLTDPAAAKEMKKDGEGHIHYQLDDGPIIATTTPKLSFHGLKPGPHKLVVMLAANDHTPLGPQETLNVTVP